MREIELLSPAADKETAIQAILHGADAVYMGAPSHGARKNAANSIADIKSVVDFAHIYRCRVYVTVNTLVYERELADVEKMIAQLYEIGVDALIVQDMGILRMNIPPIALHASTQCDTRTVEKARFLEQAGFSQIVLARELSINEIEKICSSVSVPVECFVHGALCVSYSGRCRASFLSNGRSANRGECAQMCRMAYDLVTADGKTLLKNKYLLSLRDFNATENIESMIEAGVSSFKIEGRLKETGYVKNITAWYSSKIDAVIAANPEKYRRSSFGRSDISFIPDPSKSFNRGFTRYFLEGRSNVRMASLDTPKSMGEVVASAGELNNGDGISFFNASGEYEGVRVNTVANGRIIGATPFKLPKNAVIHRTFNREWQTMLDKNTAERKMWVDIEIDGKGISAADERGVRVRIDLEAELQEAKKPMDFKSYFAKLGNTPFVLRNFTDKLGGRYFIPASQLSQLRRKVIEALDMDNLASYRFDYRRGEDRDYPFLTDKVDSTENVANSLARGFYEDHGAEVTSEAIEVIDDVPGNLEVMHTRYCIKRELGLCQRYGNRKSEYRNIRPEDFNRPLYLVSGKNRFSVRFDCKECGMRIYKA